MNAPARALEREELVRQLARARVGLTPAGQGRVIATGLADLDALLPNGGLPRGQITEMVGERGSGRTTLLVSAVVQLARRGERSAMVDLQGDLDPFAVSSLGLPSGWLWVVHPPGLREGLWAADLIVRSGHFGLVVVDGLSELLPLSVLTRLQYAARESDVALVLGTGGQEMSAPGSLKIRCRLLEVEWEQGLGGPSGLGHVRVGVQVARRGEEVPVRFACRPGQVLSRHAWAGDRRRATWTERGAPP